jgi:ribonuclease R
VHEGPTPEKRTLLQNYLKALGLGLAVSDDPQPREFQAIAAATKDRPDALQIHTMLLRSMQQAIYTGTNAGHFGLAYEAYTHFTSPIRRYPDLLVHRVIKALLHGKRYHLLSGAVEEAPKVRHGGKTQRAPNVEMEHWEVAGTHCSVNERRADEASRDVEAWLKCRYMREHLGEEFAGTVGAVTSFGLFVTLDALYVEGLVHITELGGEYYRFDEARQELRGERSGIRYVVGARVRVQVSRVDLDGRRIDFRMVREGEDDATRLRTRRDRAGEKIEGEAGELAKLKAIDRAAKAATKAKARGGKGGGVHPVRAAKATARKAAAPARGSKRR